MQDMYKKALALSALFGFLSAQSASDTFLGTQTAPLINSLPTTTVPSVDQGAPLEEFCAACLGEDGIMTTENQAGDTGSGGSGYALAFGEGGETIFVGSDGQITLDNGTGVNSVEVITEETLIQILETIIITQTVETSSQVTTGSTGGGWHLNPAEENAVIPGVGEIVEGNIILEPTENVNTETQIENQEETPVEEVVEQTTEESTGAVGVGETENQEQNHNGGDNSSETSSVSSSDTNNETSDSSDDECEDKGGLICGIKNAADDVKDGIKDVVHDVGSGIKDAVKSLFNHD